MRKQRLGFTIIEMLISMALLLIIFVVIGAMLHSSRKSYQATAAIAEEVEITDAAARLLRYDISLAGYIGLDGVERDLQGEPVLVRDNDEYPLTGKVVEVRYYEDRFTSSGDAELRYISYYVGETSRGQGLLRHDNSDFEPQILMSGVSKLTTETLDRGMNLNLYHGTDIEPQPVRIAFNIADVTVTQ